MGLLYVVATPIGNLEDITLRALRILKAVDLIVCEDTRVSKNLLNHYQIKTPTLSYHQHSSKVKVDRLISLIRAGKNLALVTDAGTPGLSDPGGKLVNEVVRELGSQVKIEVVPGPSALAAAIAVSGIPVDKFLFLGFLPHKKGRQTLLKKIAESEYPVILYESVHRINKLLSELSSESVRPASRSGAGEVGRQIILCRELTKKFETVYRGTVEEVKKQLAPAETKGEFVVIITK